jgi:hypothetical protein
MAVTIGTTGQPATDDFAAADQAIEQAADAIAGQVATLLAPCR